MRFTQAFFIGTALVSSTLADFHIIINDESIQAIPSNKYDCRAMGEGFDAFKNANIIAALSDSNTGFTKSFSMHGNLCGVTKVNFFPQSDGTLKAFVNNGDGSVLATCHRNDRKNTIHCSDGQNWSEKFLCVSSLCK